MTKIKQIMNLIKQQINVSANDSIFLYAYGRVLNGEETIGNLYKRFSD